MLTQKRFLIRLLITTSIILFCVSCTQNPSRTTNTPTKKNAPHSKYQSEVQTSIILSHIDNQIVQNKLSSIPLLIEKLTQINMSAQEDATLHLLKARYQLALGYSKSCIETLNNTQFAFIQNTQMKKTFFQTKASCFTHLNKPIKALLAYLNIEAYLETDQELSDNHETVWNLLNNIDVATLDTLATHTNSFTLKGWIELFKINHEFHRLQIFEQAIQEWQTKYQKHPANAWVKNITPTHQQDIHQIALLLPLSHPQFQQQARAIRDGLMAAYNEANKSQLQKLEIKIYDSKSEKNIKQLVELAIEHGADFIIGPLTKDGVKQTLNLPPSGVPILTLNQVHGKKANILQFSLRPEDEGIELARFAHDSGWNKAIILSLQSKLNQRIADAFTKEWKNIDGHILKVKNFNTQQDLSNIIKDTLGVSNSIKRTRRLNQILNRKVAFTPSIRQDIDMVLLIATPTVAKQAVPLFKYYYAQDLPILAGSSIFNEKIKKSEMKDINGVTFCDAPVIIENSKFFKQNKNVTNKKLHSYPRLFAFGEDAFLIMQNNQRFQQFVNLGINGKTGNLYLDSENRVHRKLEFARINQGKLEKVIHT